MPLRRVHRDYRKHTKAARLGHPYGMVFLARACRDGLGVSTDLTEAYIWYSLAIRFGLLDSRRERDDIGRKLTAGERTEADREIRQRFRQIMKNQIQQS